MQMDLSTLADTLMAKLGDTFPNILGAVAILAVGWVVALVVRVVVRRGLGGLSLNRHIQNLSGSSLDVEKGTAVGIYYLILALALVAFFNTLDLGQVSSPLGSMVEQVLTFLPNLIAAAVLALIAWLVATVLKALVSRLINSARFEERLKIEGGPPIGDLVGRVVYGLVLLLFLPGILDTLGLDGLLEPVSGVVDGILGMVPNILAGAAIGLVGWLVARVLRDIVTDIIAVTRADEAARNMGLKGTLSLSRLVGLIVFVFVLVPALIAALDALRLETISGPATQILATLMGAIPYVFAAAVILAIAVFVADLAANIGASILGGIGFDRLPEKLGLSHAIPESTTLSILAGKVLKLAILLISVVEAAKVLGFTQISEHVNTFLSVGGQVLLGVAIIAIGLWVSGIAHEAVSRLGTSGARVWAGLARFGILGLVFAMGLRAMGIAEDIVTLAFTLTLGAIAVAIALSFGLGGREAAGRQVEAWLAGMRDGGTR